MARWMMALLLCMVLASPVMAWHEAGHDAMTRAAAAALPDVVPQFLREGSDAIAHYAIDPDLMRVKPLTALSSVSGPEHYFDLELIADIEKLPETRYEFLKMLTDRNIAVRDVGMGLYALIEARQRLAVALAEYRKWPENEAIRAKCLMHAGTLAHFAQDLCQPLHTSIHHDGRVDPATGKSPRSGIHHKVDDLLRHLTPADRQLDQVNVRVIPPGAAAAYEQILIAHKLVDRVYELEPLLPAVRMNVELNPEVRAFMLDRYQAGAALTASMILSAWEDSATVELPAWLERINH